MLMEWCDDCFELTEQFATFKAGRIACKSCRIRLGRTCVVPKPPLPKQNFRPAKPSCPQGHNEWSRHGACKVCARERAKRRYTLRGRTAEETARAMWAGARARARSAGNPFTLTLAECAVPAVCPVLGIPFDLENAAQFGFAPSLDRIQPELGYARGNVIVISRLANMIKNCASRGQVQAVADCDAIWPKKLALSPKSVG